MRVHISSAIVVLALLGACNESKEVGIGDPRLPAGSEDKEDNPGAAYRDGVVTASSQVAAEAGSKVLAAGGNAVDAAAVVQFMLAVVEPQSSGLGGGSYIMVHLANDAQTRFLDASERAPDGATRDMFKGQPSPELRGSSGYVVGVPGTLQGIATMLKQWGTLSLAEALEPAIAAAEHGVRIDAMLAEDIRNGKLDHEIGNPAYDEARALLRPNGVPLEEGAVLVQPALARTLRLIAQHGVDAFYDCNHSAGIAQAIVRTQKATRAGNPDGAGSMTCEDLANYAVVPRAPLVANYRDYTVITAPPPSSGGLTLLQMLKLLEGLDIGGENFGSREPDTLNVVQEAMRLAFADRGLWIGDPDFVSVPVVGLLSPEYIRQRAGLIKVGARMPEALAGDPRPFDPSATPGGPVAQVTGDPRSAGGHTTHFNVGDGDGNLVSITSSVSSAWGSGLMVTGFGFVLNDELTNFNREPGLSLTQGKFDPGANDVAPGKRASSSMAPTMLMIDGQPVAAYGAAGGSTIINTLLMLTLDLIDQRLLLSEAILAPRITLESGSTTAVTLVEPTLTLETMVKLRRLAYSFDDAFKIGAAQVIIRFANNNQYGAADPRRGGGVAGPNR